MALLTHAPTDEVVYVMNVHVHENAKLSRKQFLERVDGVKAIRANWVRSGITWYPATAREWNLLSHLHAAVRSGDFGHVGSRPDYTYFGLVIPRPQYAWLANNDIGVLQRQVIAFLAGMYFRDSEAERFMSKQLYSPIYNEVKEVSLSCFHDEGASKYEHEEFAAYYVKQFKVYTGATPPAFLQYPARHLEDSIASAWGSDLDFHLGHGEFYMSEADWKTVIVKKEHDALLRAEAEEELWQRWKQTFELADSGGKHVFEIFATPSTKGFLYVIQQGESDLYKIGWTADADITRRMAGLQTASPEKLSIKGSFSASSRQTETTLHRMLAAHKQRGEWFRLSTEQVSQLLDDGWRSDQQIF